MRGRAGVIPRPFLFAIAALFCAGVGLVASPARADIASVADPALRALLEQQDALERQVAQLRLKKDTMDEEKFLDICIEHLWPAFKKGKFKRILQVSKECLGGRLFMTLFASS